ncbi:autoinducer 2 import system permease LsrD, partial [Bacillus mycoides]
MRGIRSLYRWEGVLLILLLVELILFSFINSDFLNISNLLFSMNDFLIISI